MIDLKNYSKSMSLVDNQFNLSTNELLNYILFSNASCNRRFNIFKKDYYCDNVNSLACVLAYRSVCFSNNITLLVTHNRIRSEHILGQVKHYIDIIASTIKSKYQTKNNKVELGNNSSIISMLGSTVHRARGLLVNNLVLDNFDSYGPAVSADIIRALFPLLYTMSGCIVTGCEFKKDHTFTDLWENSNYLIDQSKHISLHAYVEKL